MLILLGRAYFIIRISDIFNRYPYQCFLMINVNNQGIDTDNPELFLN